MTGKVVLIERVAPRSGGTERPLQRPDGRLQLADPKNGRHMKLAEHAAFARTLDDAAALIGRGFHIWMTREGKRASLICPASLRIVRS